MAKNPLSIPLRLAALALVALAVVGCGSSTKSSSSTSATTSSGAAGGGKLASELPAKYKSKALTVAADATYAPDEFIAPNGHTVQGMDADLAKAIAGELGAKPDVINATFDSILPGLAAGKYDLGMSSFTDTKARQKTVDFVTYFSAGTSFYTKANGGTNVRSLADLCGKTVAVEKGTTEQADATAQSKKCTASGKPAVKVLTYPDQNGANLAVSSGRAQIGMADSPVAEYQVKQSNGQFKITGQPYGTAPYGIAIPKGSGLDKPVLGAVKALMANGSYGRIMQKWGLQSGEIKNPQINAATS
jgi:polar amino acid transport system substrate-binding protein